MYGPEPPGHFTRHSKPGGYAFLVVGDWYRVARAFADYEQQEHQVGETWQFLGWSYAAYDDGLSLYVSLDGQREWLIRLQDWPNRQGPVIASFGEYIVPTTRAP